MTDSLHEGRCAPYEETDFPQPARATSLKSILACFLRGVSEVVVMKSVRHSHLVNLPVGLDFPWFRVSLCSPPSESVEYCSSGCNLKNPSQMSFVDDDQVIKAFPPDTPYQSLHIAILPR